MPSPGLALGSAVGGSWLFDDGGDDDLRLMAEGGLTKVRIGLPWERAQPRPGAIDGSVIERWRQRAIAAHELGLAVWCTLSSPDEPRWFENEGGFSDARLAARAWPRWVEQAAEQVGDLADGWIPLDTPFAAARRIEPDDPRRHGEVTWHLVIAWRDAWRILRGPAPVATNLDVRTVRPIDQTVQAADSARREDQLRWGLWMRGLHDGIVSIPGRADRELDDLQGACDVLGIALRDDVEPSLHRAAESGPDRPLAVTIGLRGDGDQQRAEQLSVLLSQAGRAASELALGSISVVPWNGDPEHPGLATSDRRLTPAGRIWTDFAQLTGAASNASNASSAAPNKDASAPS